MPILISQRELIFIIYRKHMYFICMLYVCYTLKIRMNMYVYVNTYMCMYMSTSKSIHMDLPHYFQCLGSIPCTGDHNLITTYRRSIFLGSFSPSL